MTVAVSESAWRSRAAVLADEIAAMGKLYSPEWRAAVQEVPRHVFVPSYFLADHTHRPSRWVHHEPDQEGIDDWLNLVYSPTTLITALGDTPDRGVLPPVSSSTKPDLMIRMLEALGVTDGMKILEIGTGTGYNAGLLAHRLGSENVFSVDIDPRLVDTARDRLHRIGYRPVLATTDGADGLPEHAPYDRIIATCALFAVPPAWITQLRTDGLVLVHIEGPLGAGNLTALRRVAADAVQGPFLPWWGCFMRRRADAGPTIGTARPTRTDAEPSTRDTPVDPALLDSGEKFLFLAQLHLPHGVVRSIRRSDDGRTVTELRAPDGSWAEIDRDRGPDGRRIVREAGPTSLWTHVETAWQQWTELGEPPWHEFGLTATPDRHTVWHRSPDGPTWSLPLPA